MLIADCWWEREWEWWWWCWWHHSNDDSDNKEMHIKCHGCQSIWVRAIYKFGLTALRDRMLVTSFISVIEYLEIGELVTFAMHCSVIIRKLLREKESVKSNEQKKNCECTGKKLFDFIDNCSCGRIDSCANVHFVCTLIFLSLTECTAIRMQISNDYNDCTVTLCDNQYKRAD